jgi:hypothetical protein
MSYEDDDAGDASFLKKVLREMSNPSRKWRLNLLEKESLEE